MKASEKVRLEFDAARKIAQGLGANLEVLTGVVEVEGEEGPLLPVSERTRHLFGKAGASRPAPKKPRAARVFLGRGWRGIVASPVPSAGSRRRDRPAQARRRTVLDRVHQAMILFGTGRAGRTKTFLTEGGSGNRCPRFGELAQSLSALYPAGTNEKRWVDGVLARKKGLGF